MLNTIIIQGRIAKLNELKFTQSQKSVLNFTVACDRDFDRENTDFIPVTAWGKTADFIDAHFEKGQMILIKGRLQLREWTDDNDKRHTVAEVVAENVNFCGDKKKPDEPRPAKKPVDVEVDGQYSVDDTPSARFQELNSLAEEDLPFD